MPVEREYQKAFFNYTCILTPVGLGALCREHDISMDSLLAWIDADPVRKAKMQEVTQTRILEREKNIK